MTLSKPQQVAREAKRKLGVYLLAFQIMTNSPKKCRCLAGDCYVLLRFASGPKGVDLDSGPTFGVSSVGFVLGFFFQKTFSITYQV